MQAVMWSLIGIVGFIIWILQAFLAGAIEASYHLGEFELLNINWRDEFGPVFLVALALPIFGLIASYCINGFARHGVKFWRLINN